MMSHVRSMTPSFTTSLTLSAEIELFRADIVDKVRDNICEIGRSKTFIHKTAIINITGLTWKL